MHDLQKETEGIHEFHKELPLQIRTTRYNSHISNGRTMEKQYDMLLAWSSTLICKLSYLCNSEEKQILCMRTNQNASAIFLTWKLVHIADRDFHKKL